MIHQGTWARLMNTDFSVGIKLTSSVNRRHDRVWATSEEAAGAPLDFQMDITKVDLTMYEMSCLSTGKSKSEPAASSLVAHTLSCLLFTELVNFIPAEKSVFTRRFQVP